MAAKPGTVESTRNHWIGTYQSRPVVPREGVASSTTSLLQGERKRGVEMRIMGTSCQGGEMRMAPWASTAKVWKGLMPAILPPCTPMVSPTRGRALLPSCTTSTEEEVQKQKPPVPTQVLTKVNGER